jgi:hypothetical protein
MYNLLVDANVWIKFARSKNISPLPDRFVTYSFLPVTNNYLLAEIYEAFVCGDGGSNDAVYWKNGVIHILGEGGATGIALGN